MSDYERNIVDVAREQTDSVFKLQAELAESRAALERVKGMRKALASVKKSSAHGMGFEGCAYCESTNRTAIAALSDPSPEVNPLRALAPTTSQEEET